MRDRHPKMPRYCAVGVFFLFEQLAVSDNRVFFFGRYELLACCFVRREVEGREPMAIFICLALRPDLRRTFFYAVLDQRLDEINALRWFSGGVCKSHPDRVVWAICFIQRDRNLSRYG